MPILYILLGLIAGIAGAVVVVFIFNKKNQSNPDALSEEFFNKFNEKFPQIINQANASLVAMASAKLDTQSKQIEVDLANKKVAIEDMVKRVLDEMKQNASKLEEAEKNRVGSFEGLKEALDQSRRITEQLSVTTDSLRKVLSNNQMRGAFGEKVAEDLLRAAGFVRGVQYEFNKEQSSTETRPDFTVFLPDGAKINVDAKFPYNNLTKMSETENAEQKNEYLKLFERDVKDKIRQVCTRDYIDPESKTVDFCILFIPNEMIFSFIYDKMPSVWEEALAKKVVFCGPFSFTAILRMVYQAYQNFRYQENVQNIISYIKMFEKEFVKYNEEFEKLGTKIESLSKHYNEINTTRTTKLLRTVDKIKLEDNQTEHQPINLLE